MQDLERDGTVEARIAREINCSHPALAQYSENVESVEGLRDFSHARAARFYNGGSLSVLRSSLSVTYVSKNKERRTKNEERRTKNEEQWWSLAKIESRPAESMRPSMS